jgi:hypothetical protein
VNRGIANTIGLQLFIAASNDEWVNAFKRNIAEDFANIAVKSALPRGNGFVIKRLGPVMLNEPVKLFAKGEIPVLVRPLYRCPSQERAEKVLALGLVLQSRNMALDR